MSPEASVARKRTKPADLSQVRTTPLASRRHLVHLPDLARVGEPGLTFADFLANLPRQLAANTFRELVSAIVEAHRRGKPVIWGLGAHVIKVGLSPWIIVLMRRGIVTAVGLNGGGSIQDLGGRRGRPAGGRLRPERGNRAGLLRCACRPGWRG
jgi:hypothetical protein